MGQVIDNCYNCRRPLREIDFQRGRAIQVGSLSSCDACAGPLLERLTPEQQRNILRKVGEAPDEAYAEPPPEAPPPVERVPTHATRAHTPRPPTVAPRPHAAPPPPPRKSGVPPVVWIAGAGTILLALIFALAGGSGRPTTRTKKPDTATRRTKTTRDRGASSATRRATPAPPRVDALRTEIAALEKEIRAKTSDGKYREAFEAVEAARPRHEASTWTMAVTRIDKEARDAADGAFFRIKSDALDAQRSGDADGVKRQRDAVAAWGIPRYVEMLDKALADLVRKRTSRNLAGWWAFDETSGRTAADASGNGRNGTLRGTADWRPFGGRSGGALRITGPNARAECPGIELARRSFTVAAWFRRERTDRWDIFLGQGDKSRNKGLHLGFRDNGKFTFAFYTNDLDTKSAIADTDWNHWVGTYDHAARKRRIYRNGRKVAEQTCQTPYQGSGPLVIGRGPNHDARGWIDDIRIYTCALSDAEVQTLFESSVTRPASTNAKGPIGWWKLDAAPGSTAPDASGNKLDGRLVGSPVQADRALVFDGEDDYVDTGFALDLPAWTVSVWVKSPDPPGKGNSSGPVHREGHFQINWNHGDPNFQGMAALKIGNTWHAAGFGALEGNRWYHLAATYDGETLRTYTDGAPAKTNEEPSGPPDPERFTMKIGRHATYGSHFKGAVRDVRVYDRALSAEEIKALFAER
jgi:hypothetical protein